MIHSFASKIYQNSIYVYPGARCETLELVDLIWFSASSAFSSNASSTLLSEGDSSDTEE